MGTITSNIGLISGINYSDLVDKLIQVESGPVNNQTARNNTFSQQSHRDYVVGSIAFGVAIEHRSTCEDQSL